MDVWDLEKKQLYIARISEDLKMIDNLNQYVRQFAALFKGTKGAEAKIANIDVANTLKRLKEGNNGMLEDQSINFDWVIKPNADKDIWMHQASFESVISNLFSNSYRALTRVGRKKKLIKATFEKSLSHLIIRFYDNGHGIEELDHEAIFEPLWTTYKSAEAPGTGMGTTLMREIIEEDYVGEIKVENSTAEITNPGKGETTIVIRIPLEKISKV
jgi:signal transduction histidine kinase